jgi:hypothetical protein
MRPVLTSLASASRSSGIMGKSRFSESSSPAVGAKTVRRYSSKRGTTITAAVRPNSSRVRKYSPMPAVMPSAVFMKSGAKRLSPRTRCVRAIQ